MTSGRGYVAGGRSRRFVDGLKLTSVLYPLLSGVITRVVPFPAFIPMVIQVVVPRVAVSVGHGVIATVTIITDVRNGSRINPRLGSIIQAAAVVATVLWVLSPVPAPPVIIGISSLPWINISRI